jgi:hypothetical protein
MEQSKTGVKPEGEKSPRRDDEATSSETLSDIEETENVPSGSSSDTGSPLEGSTPRPSTNPDGRADGSDTGGPM